MLKLIVARSQNSVIGQDNKIPWDYPEDLKFFRAMTVSSTVIMGKNTFHSIGRPLPKRRNLVLSSRMVPRVHPEVEQFLSMKSAINACNNDGWIIGGAKVYEEGMKYADELYITEIPRFIKGENLIFFPDIDETKFKLKDTIEISKEQNLYCSLYARK